WSLALSVVLAAGPQAAALVIPWLTGAVIDHALPDRSGRLLAVLVGLVALAGLLKALMLLGRRFIAGRQALGVEFDMRNALYAHLLRLSWGFYDRNQTGQLMSRATNDLQQVRFFLGYGLVFFFQNLLTVASVSVVLFFFEWRLAFVVLAVTPLPVALAYPHSHAAHPP